MRGGWRVREEERGVKKKRKRGMGGERWERFRISLTRTHQLKPSTIIKTHLFSYKKLEKKQHFSMSFLTAGEAASPAYVLKTWLFMQSKLIISPFT